MKFVEVEGEQTEAKEGRSIEADHMGIISTLFSDVITDQPSDYHVHTQNDGMGCYNTDCQGFVLSNVSGTPVLGGKVAPLSTYDGKDYFVTLTIKKDLKTEDWSLYRDDNSEPILIGWWPKALFNNTFDYATKIMWAAGVHYPKNETSPPMGSGHAATEGANKAAYISHIKVYNHFGYPSNPSSYPSDVKVEELTDRYDCFSTDGFQMPQSRHNNFYYGGPPGCKN
ncbi:hypothetical protein FCM35_KLT04535 [Carex littledalei]|uniref:Neprosin PEP catalytic domain-containing protein n=1 Tax=Carex littledalei TaxID=544730 RepID=A0A833VAP4_9POAL|nr:hypothetical protein FCM35_KLT04535 [Carex littledalei]